ETEGMLTFDAVDDGTGFDAQGHARGAGFVNMADRLGALGGSLRVDSAPGRGTTVSGAVPARARTPGGGGHGHGGAGRGPTWRPPPHHRRRGLYPSWPGRSPPNAT